MSAPAQLTVVRTTEQSPTITALLDATTLVVAFDTADQGLFDRITRRHSKTTLVEVLLELLSAEIDHDLDLPQWAAAKREEILADPLFYDG